MVKYTFLTSSSKKVALGTNIKKCELFWFMLKIFNLSSLKACFLGRALARFVGVSTSAYTVLTVAILVPASLGIQAGRNATIMVT